MRLTDIFKNRKKNDMVDEQESVKIDTRTEISYSDKQLKKEFGKHSIFDSACKIKDLYNFNGARKIRLMYVNMQVFTRDGYRKIGKTFGISSPFEIPTGMSINNAFKVISYLSDVVEEKSNLEPSCEQTVAIVSDMLEDYGFKKIEGYDHGHFHCVADRIPFKTIQITHPIIAKEIDSTIVDLFTVDGDVSVFEHSDLNPRYFNWYTENVTSDKVRKIYSDIKERNENLEEMCENE